MLSYYQILEKIKSGQWDYHDAQGNTLLHLLLAQEEDRCVPLGLVREILSHRPEQANIKNKLGFLPAQTLESSQPLNGRISNRPVRRLLFKYMDSGSVKNKFEKSIEMSFWEQLAESKTTPHESSHAIPLHTPLFQKPTLIFFSGQGGFYSKFVLGVARYFRKSLKLWHTPTPQIQLLFAQYPGNQRDLANDCTQMHHPLKSLIHDHPMFYVRPFVREYIRPLYVDEKHQKRPLLDVLKNVRLLNFAGYSYGASVIQMIADAMKLDMQKYHFSEAEIKKVQSQIPVVLMGPYLNPSHCKNYFQTLHLINGQDDFICSLLHPALGHNSKPNTKFFWTTLAQQKNHSVLMVHAPVMATDEIKPGKILMDDDDSGDQIGAHHIRTYCQLKNPTWHQANLWKNKIIFNMLRNTRQNMTSKRFIPIGHLVKQCCLLSPTKER